VAEHSLGKGEVKSSILFMGTPFTSPSAYDTMQAMSTTDTFKPKAVRDAFFAYAKDTHSSVLYELAEHADTDTVYYYREPKAYSWVPRHDTPVAKAFWAGFDGKKNQQQFPIGSKLECIYKAGKAYWDSLGFRRLAGYRMIFVDNKPYSYCVGHKYIVIIGDTQAVYEKELCGPKGRTADRKPVTVIGPGIIAYLIKHGKPPETHPEFCSLHNKFMAGAPEVGDPFDGEIHDRYSPMLACPQCFHERAMDI
jgi:hypothetical protein